MTEDFPEQLEPLGKYCRGYDLICLFKYMFTTCAQRSLRTLQF